MKIFIINPDYGVSRKDMDDRCRILQNFTGSDVFLHMECLRETKVEINSLSDVFLAAPEILQMGCVAEKEGYDAVVLYCFSDPAAEALREKVNIPVIGGAQTSLYASLCISRHVSILLADKSRIPEKRNFLSTFGISSERITSVDAIDFHGKSIWDNREEALEELIQKGMEMKEKGAECIVLGCLSFLGLASSVSETIHIPVIDPAVSAVSMAESMVRQKLSNSKISYPPPYNSI